MKYKNIVGKCFKTRSNAKRAINNHLIRYPKFEMDLWAKRIGKTRYEINEVEKIK